MTLAVVPSQLHKLPPSDVVCPLFFLNSATKKIFHSGVTPLDGVILGRPPPVTPLRRRRGGSVWGKLCEKRVRTTMHSCHNHLSHHRTIVLDSVHILSSYRNAQLISLTVTSWCECCTKTPTRPRLFYTLQLGTAIHCLIVVSLFLMCKCAFCHALFTIKWWWWWWWW